MWGEDEIVSISIENKIKYGSDVGQALFRMLRHYQSGDRAVPTGQSPIWLLELLQNAIDAGAGRLKLIFGSDNTVIITHDSSNRKEQGMQLDEVKALSNVSTTTKSLSSIGFFGIGFKSVFNVFQEVRLATKCATGGHVLFHVGGTLPLSRSDMLNTTLPEWIPEPLPLSSNIMSDFYDTTFVLSGWRFLSESSRNVLKEIMSCAWALWPILKIHGLRDVCVVQGEQSIEVMAPLDGQYFAIEVPWVPSKKAMHSMIKMRDLSVRSPIRTALYLRGVIRLPIHTSCDSLVYSTFPTQLQTGLGFCLDGPFMVDANRRNLCWDNGRGKEWNGELVNLIPCVIKKVATWLPSYINGLSREKRFVEQELNAGLKLIFEWKKDIAKNKTLMGHYLISSAKENELCKILSHVPFIPVKRGNNEYEWVCPVDITWPSEWCIEIRNAYELYPTLPCLKRSHLKCVYNLSSRVAFPSNFNLTAEAIRRWLSSFSDPEEANQALQELWTKAPAGIKIPCIPVHVYSVDMQPAAVDPVKRGDSYNFVPFSDSVYHTCDVPAMWLEVIIECVQEVKLTAHVVAKKYNDAVKQYNNAVKPNGKRIPSVMDVCFITTLLSKVGDMAKRFDMAIRFAELRYFYAVQTSVRDVNYWVVTEEAFVAECKHGASVYPFPTEWMSNLELSTSAKDSLAKAINSSIIESATCCHVHTDMINSSCRVSPLEWKKALFDPNTFLDIFIVKRTRRTHDEREAREFGDHVDSKCNCTGWGSRRGYTLIDFELTPVALNSIEFLPYALNMVPQDDLMSRLYRKANFENSPSSARLADWLDKIDLSQPEFPEFLLRATNNTEKRVVKLPSLSCGIGIRRTLPPICELQRRDEVNRNYFIGKDWDNNEEWKLKRDFVIANSEDPFSLLIDDEWEVLPNRTDVGRGDLLFANASGTELAVVETKANKCSTNANLRRQAEKYALMLYNLYGHIVKVRAYTVMQKIDNLKEVELNIV